MGHHTWLFKIQVLNQTRVGILATAERPPCPQVSLILWPELGIADCIHSLPVLNVLTF